MRGTGLTIAALVWTMPAAAQTLTMEPGQSVSAHIDGSRTTFHDEGQAELIPFDAMAINQLRGATKAGQLGYQMLKSSDETPPAITPDTIHLRFISSDGEAVLILDNGYGRGMSYRAKMTLSDGRNVATDVCMVRPGKLSYEYWPHDIKRLELSNFAFLDWKEGDPAPCV